MKYLILAILIIFSVSCTTDGPMPQTLTWQDLHDISSDPIARNELAKSFQKHFGTPNETYTITRWEFDDEVDTFYNDIGMDLVVETSAPELIKSKHTKENFGKVLEDFFGKYGNVWVYRNAINFPDKPYLEDGAPVLRGAELIVRDDIIVGDDFGRAYNSDTRMIDFYAIYFFLNDSTPSPDVSLKILQGWTEYPDIKAYYAEKFGEICGTPTNETYTIETWEYGDVASDAVPMTIVIKTSANTLTSDKHTKENVEEFIRWMFNSFDGITITGDLGTGTGDVTKMWQ